MIIQQATEKTTTSSLLTIPHNKKATKKTHQYLDVLKHNLCLLLFLFLTCATASGQTPLRQTIRGVIRDRLSGAPLSSISVKIINNDKIETLTASDGTFTLEKVGIGRQSIQASSIGYETILIQEILLNTTKEAFLEIEMNPTEVKIDSVAISLVANKEQVLNKMALAGARLLRMEEASRYAGGMDDPARLVSSFAGVSTGIGNNGISVHGNSPSLLQWRMEGIEIPNPNHFADIATLGGGVISSLSMNVLGNSDFYSAAFPAEYHNAISGVFDMKMRQGNNQQYEHTFQAGLLGLDIALEGPFRKGKDASYLMNYRYSTTGLMNKMSPSDTKNQLLDYQDLNFKLNFPLKKAGTLSFWGTALADEFRTKKEAQSTWKYIDDGKSSRMQQIATTVGLNHRYFFVDGATWNTTLASTYTESKASEDYYDDTEITTPHLNLENRYTNLILTSSFDKKHSPSHTNKTGFTLTNMRYNTNLGLAPMVGRALETISTGQGSTWLISAYSSSLLQLNNTLSATLGMNSQLLTLNKHWTVEPRASIKWQSSSNSTLAFAYGLHSRMEKMDTYYVQDKLSGRPMNKNLDFTKTHHISLSYQHKLSDHLNLKAEPYFQYLFDVPVIADSSYSILNRSLFYAEDALINAGKGKNLGFDLTLERYLTKGFYYMITASIFNSQYTGGDGIWHNTKYNRNFIINGLTGKEWMLGTQKRDLLSINLKLTWQGGNRYSAVDEALSLSHPEKETQYDETQAYSKQFAPMFLANYSISYKMNRKARAHELAIKWLNATRTTEYFGHAYHLQTGLIEPKKQATSLVNLLYRIDF